MHDMQLAVETLEEQLTQQRLKARYLLVSSEPFLLQEIRDSIWHAADAKGFSDRQIWEVKPQFNWESLKQANYHSDLFHRPFFELRLTQALDASKGKQLQAWVETLANVNASPFAPAVVVSIEGWISKLQRSQWFQKLASISTLVVIEKPYLSHLPYWINKQLKKVRLTLTQEAIATLIQFTEGNLLAAKQTIHKLSLIYGDDEQAIGVEPLRLVLDDQVIFELSHLTEAILSHQPGRCIRILKYFESNNTPPALVLGCLLKLLRTVSGLQDGLDHQHNINQLFEKYSVWQKQQAGFKRVVAVTSKEKIADLFSLAHHADRCIKGVSQESSWRYLQQLSLSLAGSVLPLKMPLQY